MTPTKQTITSEHTPEKLARPTFEILTKFDKRADLEIASDEDVEVAVESSTPPEKHVSFDIGSDYDDGDDQNGGCFPSAKPLETCEGCREINAVSKAVSKEVNIFSDKYGLWLRVTKLRPRSCGENCQIGYGTATAMSRRC